MTMAIATDTSRNSPTTLTTSREPVAPKDQAKAGSMGDVALKDALLIVIGAWVVLFLLVFSLRSANI